MPTIRHLETAQDLEGMLDATAAAFQPGYLSARRAFREHQNDPRHRPELSRILEVDGAVASSVRIVDRDFRIGKAVFRLGGIADVATHPDYQKQGYCALLFQEVVAFMAAEGYDLSLLFGIPNFYHRFGYATALVPATLTVSAVHLADLPAAATRPFPEGDLPALSALLEADLEARACAIVRDEALWRYRGVPNALTVVEQEGRPAAYFTAEERKDDLLVREAVAAGDACRALVSALGARAAAAGKETIRVQGVPPDHPVARCLCLRGARVELCYERNQGGMMRILRLEDTLRKLLPELERRLAASPLGARSTSLGFDTDLGSFGLVCEKGSITLAPAATAQVTLPQWALLQMMTGFASPGDLLLAGSATAAPEAIPWLEALFPRRWPTAIPTDCF